VFLIAFGAQVTGIRNKHGQGILQAELQSLSQDMSILKAAVKSLANLPTLTELGLTPKTRVNPPAPPHPHPHHHLHHPPAPPPLALSNPNVRSMWEWYAALSTSPRSLQHNCRSVVRRALMANGRLRDLHKLPLPATLKDYLMLEYDEYR
jgi:hypothetical protein